jgi:Spy/CpxP family protein refolding chaperone
MNAEKLGLSDEQIKKLGEIKSECDREFVLDRDNLRAAKLELDDLLKSDEIDMKKVGEKSREISELMHKVTIKRVKTKVRSMMILTDKQKEKARKLFEK